MLEDSDFGLGFKGPKVSQRTWWLPLPARTSDDGARCDAKPSGYEAIQVQTSCGCAREPGCKSKSRCNRLKINLEMPI